VDDKKATDMFKTIVGAIYKSTDMDDPKDIDGIIGFAGQGASAANTPTAFDNFVKATGIEDIFSLCLRDSGDSAAYLGAEPGITDSPDIKWTPRLANSPFYAVALDDVMVGGKSLGVDPSVYQDGDCIVDSGTSDNGFPKSAMKKLKTTFASMCKTKCLKGICNCKTKKPLNKIDLFENKCVKMTDEDRAQFPDITLSFGTPATSGSHSGGGGKGDDTTTSSTLTDRFGDKVTTKTSADVFGNRVSSTTARDSFGDITTSSTLTTSTTDDESEGDTESESEDAWPVELAF